MSATLAVIETENTNPDKQADELEWLEVAGYVIKEPQQGTFNFVIDTHQAEAKDYKALVGERRVVSIWANGKIVRYVAKLENDGFEIPYSLTES